jgi:hypothetical protein
MTTFQKLYENTEQSIAAQHSGTAAKASRRPFVGRKWRTSATRRTVEPRSAIEPTVDVLVIFDSTMLEQTVTAVWAAQEQVSPATQVE